MPILGIIASQNYSRIAPDTGAMFPIQMINLGSATSSVTFSNIPSTYKHLQLRMSCSTSTGSDIWMRLNGDTNNANYASHILWGNGASPFASAFGTALGSYLGYSGSTTSFVGATTDILDYGSTSKNKTVRTLSGSDANGSGQIYLASGLWMNSSTATSSLFISPASGTFNQYSQFALYGIK
jgi:hypothetical protein